MCVLFYESERLLERRVTSLFFYFPSVGCGQTWQFVNPVSHNLLYRQIQSHFPKLDPFASVLHSELEPLDPFSILTWIRFHSSQCQLDWNEVMWTWKKPFKSHPECLRKGKELDPDFNQHFQKYPIMSRITWVWTSRYRRSYWTGSTKCQVWPQP